ncbi:MAG: nicotinate phosphoribosyltransferase [Acholeplasmataceae bacterium]|nr:nicotinate phosphoribosyltransferase [Acholeplasmataceae bacterium]
MIKRPPVSYFKIPVEIIKSGFYTDNYFLRTAEILKKDNYRPRVLMQVFQRERSVLCGVNEAIAILRTCAENPDRITIRALNDGDEIAPWETCMTIEGDLADFAHLETVYLGVLARQTRIATNVRRAVEAAGRKQVLFFSARYDTYHTQEQDGYAAMIGGIKDFSTDANGIAAGVKGLGTIPHALIAAYRGDTLAATEAFDRHIDENVSRIALVDFDNDCVNTSLAVARKLGAKLKGVRLDTSNYMVDKSIQSQMGLFPPTGVCKELVTAVRRALDTEGFTHVKIIVSGGFNAKKIAEFESLNVPVDTYAIGSSFFDGNINFTADVVLLDGKPCAKAGRTYLPNSRLELIE